MKWFALAASIFAADIDLGIKEVSEGYGEAMVTVTLVPENVEELDLKDITLTMSPYKKDEVFAIPLWIGLIYKLEDKTINCAASFYIMDDDKKKAAKTADLTCRLKEDNYNVQIIFVDNDQEL